MRRRRRYGRSSFRTTLRLAKVIDRKLATKREVTEDLVGTFGAFTNVSGTAAKVTLEPTLQRGTGATAGDFTGDHALITKCRIRGLIHSGTSAARDEFVRLLLLKVKVGDVPYFDDAGPPARNEVLQEKCTTAPSITDFRAWNPQPKYKIIFDKILKVRNEPGSVTSKYIKMSIRMNIKYTVDLAGTVKSSDQYVLYFLSGTSTANEMPRMYLHGRYTYADMS